MPRKKTERDPRYHDTLLLMKKYRDVVWSLSVAAEQSRSEFREIYGKDVDEFLDSVYDAGIGFEGTEIQARARCMERSRKMLNFVDSAVSVIREKNKNGELYYQILYWSYMSPRAPMSRDEIMRHLEDAGFFISMRTMDNYRAAAVDCLSTILWGYTALDCEDILSRFVSE